MTLSTNAQDGEITGQWNGVLEVQGMQLRIVFNINQTDAGYTGTMDSPDQKVTGIPVDAVSYENKQLKLSIAAAGIEYEGTLGEDKNITGNFKQAGQSFPLNLSREAVEEKVVNRPQEPKEPFPYRSEDITFENKGAEISLAGTLTMPEKGEQFPAVILISGSGPQDRNEEVFNHKPFLVLADHLTKAGMAVLRFDDRGVGESKGTFKTATSADFATDVQAAFDYLKTRKEINAKKIGLMGHSEGGVIAPMVASESKDIAFVVLLAGTGIRGDQLLLIQQELLGKAAGASEEELKQVKQINQQIFEMVNSIEDNATLEKKVRAIVSAELEKETDKEKMLQGKSEADFVQSQIDQVMDPWLLYFLRHNPAPVLEKVQCPVLAINGEKDLQVPASINLGAIAVALKKGGNTQFTTKALPNLNHLFQECDKGTVEEYGQIEQTFSPEALKIISEWLGKQIH